MKKLLILPALALSLAGCITVPQFIALVQAATPAVCQGVVPVGETITDFVLAYLNGGQVPADESQAEAYAKQIAASLCDVMKPKAGAMQSALHHPGHRVDFGVLVVKGHPVHVLGEYRR